jgi:hypothetical protein
MRLREFQTFVQDLGIEAVTTLLRSGALSVFPDFVAFSTGLEFSGVPRPAEHISISRVSGFRQISFPQYMQDLYAHSTLVSADLGQLEAAIRWALAPEIRNYGVISEECTYRDIAANPEALKMAVATYLKRSRGFAIGPSDFELAMHPLERAAYRAETDLPSLCRLPEEDVYSAVGLAMTVLAQLNLRLEEMQAHNSVSGFNDDDLHLFENRIRFLLDRNNAHPTEAAFRRVADLLAIPDVPIGEFDVEKFLTLRASAECIEFRRWLSDTADWSDAEILGHVNGLHQTVARYYQGCKGKVFRVLGSIGIGLLSTAAGAVLSVLDTFILDRVLKPSGAISFIASDYKSLFDT